MKAAAGARTVWITGGARGIGRATAIAHRALGDRVIIGDVSGAAESARELGIRGLPLDVADPASWAAFAAEAPAPDVLVNNAGIMPVGRFVDDAAWRRTVDVNLQGVILGMQAILPGMLARRSGHVINVASMMGRLHVPGAAVYGATKHAVVALGRSVRDELDGSGVRVSTVLPTLVRTELAAGVPLGGGVPSVAPEDVAAAIVGCDGDEVFVPRWLRFADVALAIAPSRLLRLVRRALDADRLLTRLDREARRAYDLRSAESTVRH